MSSDTSGNTPTGNTLWGGRFSESTDAFVQAFTAFSEITRCLGDNLIGVQSGSLCNTEHGCLFLFRRSLTR